MEATKKNTDTKPTAAASTTTISLKNPARVVCVSGTFNPPHRGHALIGIQAAEQLRRAGINVACIVFLPVHDNYLWNKLSPEADEHSAPVCVPMETRVNLLKELLRNEKTDFKFHVLPFERDEAASHLKESEYWERKLGKAHLPTMPTSDLLLSFSKIWVSKHFGPTAKVSVVFGFDNLPWMPIWHNASGLFSDCDLVLVSRPEATTNGADTGVAFQVDPTSFMRNFKAVQVQSVNPVTFKGQILFGNHIGESTPKCCSPDATSTLYLMEPLRGMEGLSSTAVRRAIAVLARHGYARENLNTTLTQHHDKGKETLDSILEKHNNPAADTALPKI